ncbi:MAG TPA: tagatose-6-phosphate ketose isomerase [Candidatus Koribacter sp.]|jgi:tagatose-6-phosphate ketose/aldose isomerase
MTVKQSGLKNPLVELVDLSHEEKSARGLLHTPTEIVQQPTSWQETYSRISREKENLQKFLNPILASSPTVYLIGAGTSDYIGRALASILRQQWQCDVIAVPSTELITNMESYVLPNRPYLWISFSRSGDSSEGVGVLEMAMRKYPHVHHLVVSCNQYGKMSELCAGQSSAYVLLLADAVNDRGLAMTSSFTNMVLAGHCLAHLRSLDQYKPILESLVRMGNEILQQAPAIAENASRLHCRKACFVGTGAMAAAATESSLKCLELTAGAISAFSESTMGLRHGPMSALDAETLIVTFISADERRRKFELDLLKEIFEKQLGRVRIAVAPADVDLHNLADHLIALTSAPDIPDDYRVPVDVILGQLIGLFSSLDHGLKPDAPSPSGVISRVVSHVHIYH